MKKKVFILLLTVIIAAAGMPVLNTAALNDDIGISYSVSEARIFKGDYFTLSLTFSKEDNDVGDEVSCSIADNDFFSVVSGSSSVDADFDEVYKFNMQYLGGSEKLPLKINYKKDGKAQTIYENVVIDEIEEESISSSPSGSDNEPKLVIESTAIPAATAGETMKIPLTITNESKYAAKNISVKLSLEDSSNDPFDVESLNLTQSIGSLNPKKSEGVIFNLKVQPYAEEKTYTMRVSFSYTNSKNTSFTSSEVIYVKVTNNKNEPALIIQDIKYSPNPVKAGDGVVVSFNVTNLGDLQAEGVKLSIEGLRKEEFTLRNGVDSWYFDRIEGNEKKNITANLVAADSMRSGNYGLEVKMEYKDQRKNSYSNDASFFVNVQGGSRSSKVSVKNITVMPQEVKTNENFMLSFDILNEGKTPVKDIKVSVKGDDGLISKSPDLTIVEELEAGKGERLEYILYASDEAKTKNYNVLINLEYEDSEKEDSRYSVNQYAGVYVNGGNSKITPKIIISNYDFEPKVVRAGEEFSMEMTFMNTSMTKEVKNIKIYLTGIDSDKEGNVVFTPVGSSNTFFVDSIKPKGTVKRNIVMYTIPDAQPKYYNITANMEYQDDEGTEYKAEELIGIPVIQQSKLDASEISLPPEVFIGQPVPISLQYYNKGKAKLTNLMIKVEGDFQVENGEAFIGNFESGSSDYYEAMLTADKPGNSMGKVVFTFEDPSGEEHKYEREFELNAIEMPPMNMPENMPPEPMSFKDKAMNSTLKNKFFWIGIVVIGAAIAVAVKLIRKKRRKGFELDE